MKPKFKVYNKVWAMQWGRPVELVVFAVVESMDYPKRGTETRYRLVDSQVGAGWGNNEGEIFEEDSVFATKEELKKHVFP